MFIFEYLLPIVLIYLVIFPCSLCAQAQTRAQSPAGTVAYQGDTNEDLVRRAKWIEEAKREGQLAWWGSTNPAESNKITAGFKSVYPFIKVNYWRGGDTERVTRLESEHSLGRLTVDIMEGGDPTNLPRWRKLGITSKYVDAIPAIKKLDKRMYSRYSDWASWEHVTYAPQFNTRRVPAAEAPKSWEDLLNPKWKGHIGMTADMRTWYIMALAEGGWGIEKTEEFLRKLKQQDIVWAPGHSAGFALLVAGEYKIHAENPIRYILQASPEKRALVNWSRANPVPAPGGFNLLPAKAPHPYAALLFMEYMFSPQGVKVFDEATGKGLVFPGSESRQAKAVEGLKIIYKTEDVVLKAGEMGLTERFAKILGVTPE